VHTGNDSEISLPLPFNGLAPSSPAYAWWGKIFSDARILTMRVRWPRRDERRKTALNDDQERKENDDG
jgi:surfactin synthase thioesterase subunit